MSRYRNASYLEEINAPDDEEVLQAAPDPETQEELTWKKRYGDLRRKLAQDETAVNQRIAALEQQLEVAAKAQIKYPKTEAEVAAWVKQYPDVADVIKTMILVEKDSIQNEIKSARQELIQTKAERDAEKAYNDLLKLHPDFDEIRALPEFHDWVKEQSKWVSDALYVNETDVKAADDAIRLYKADVAKVKKAAPPVDRQTQQRQAAQTIRAPRAPEPSFHNDGEWSESRVASLSRYEYDQYEDEIDKAIRSGKMVYDLSGGAR